MTPAEIEQLAETIHGFEFDHVFTLHPGGSITEPPNTREFWAPSVFHDDDADVFIDGPGWEPLTGLTGQDRYHGAVMHPSEYIGAGIAAYLQELAADEPQTFVVVVVECFPEDDDPEPEPAGWAILRHVGDDGKVHIQ